MAEIGTLRKWLEYVVGMGRYSELLSLNRPSSAPRAERRFAKLNFKQVGFYPFRGPDASPTHPHGITDSSTERRRRNTETENSPPMFPMNRSRSDLVGNDCQRRRKAVTKT